MHPIELSQDRGGIFAGDDPFAIVRAWMAEAEASEINDPDATALATVDGEGVPNVRVVLLKEVTDEGFVFFTNYCSQKAAELDTAGVAAGVLHWKSLRRQIRFRGRVERVAPEHSDRYFASRSVFSRIGAWASRQSAPLTARAELEARAEALARELGDDPSRPENWGGYIVRPLEIEFWCDGAHRLHDRFRWTRLSLEGPWRVARLNP